MPNYRAFGSKPFLLAAALLIVLLSSVTKRVGYGAPPPPVPCAGSSISSWARSYGGSDYDYALTAFPTVDGNILLGGYTNSFGASNFDAWILKVNSSGEVIWQKILGGGGFEEIKAITSTSDGGYIAVGSTKSFGAGDYDLWILKLNSSGNLVWQKTYGGPNADFANQYDSVTPTSDGGFVIAATTFSYGNSYGDLWVLKIDGSGNVAWQKTFGGGGTDGYGSIAPSADGGYVIAGESGSYGGFLSTMIVKLDEFGNVVWQKAYTGNSDSIFVPRAMTTTNDGGYLVAGLAGIYPSYLHDAWVLKIDGSGNVAWQKSYGGVNKEMANAIVRLGNGSYALVGQTESFGNGSADGWILNLDGSGNILWQKTYGLGNYENTYSAVVTNDGHLLVGGFTGSFGVQGYDAWLLKLSIDGAIGTSCVAIGVSDSSIDTSSAIAKNIALTTTNSNAMVAQSSSTISDTAASESIQCLDLDPLLLINYNEGAPESYFTLTGIDFPVSTEATIRINGHVLGIVQSDMTGGLVFLLSTDLAGEGVYFVEAAASGKKAAVSFRLNNNAPLRPQEGVGPIFPVPAGIAFDSFMLLPVVWR
jgi:hypothetical protein